MYVDKPITYDNWNIDIYYTEKYWNSDELTRMEWTEHQHLLKVHFPAAVYTDEASEKE